MTQPLSSAEFETFASTLKTRSGLAISPDKLYLLETRLAPIVREHNRGDLPTLARRLRAPAADRIADQVVQAMTTNESSFFRDATPFAHARARVFPRLLQRATPQRRIRVWSAAASTGQEAYSLAMILSDLAGVSGAAQAEIVATDIARDQLVRAREGLYSQFEIQRGVPMQMLARYFRKEDAMWRIAQPLRQMVRFREWNLLSDLRPLGMFDIVFCRNVLIYFDPPTKTRVLNAIARQMRPDGVLYLGGAESILGLTESFTPIQGERGVYALAAAAALPSRAAAALVEA